MITLGILRIGRMSTAIKMFDDDEEEDLDMVREATWVHPPGAAQRSMTTLALSRKWNLRFIWVNLKAARERYPDSFATAY